MMLETLRGEDDFIDFPDFLNIPHEAPVGPKLTLHDRAERQYGIIDPSARHLYV